MCNGKLLSLPWGAMDLESVNFQQELGFWFFADASELSTETWARVEEKSKEWCQRKGLEYHKADFAYDECEVHMFLTQDAPMRYDLAVSFDHSVINDFDSVFLEITLGGHEDVVKKAILTKMEHDFFGL